MLIQLKSEWGKRLNLLWSSHDSYKMSLPPSPIRKYKTAIGWNLGIRKIIIHELMKLLMKVLGLPCENFPLYGMYTMKWNPGTLPHIIYAWCCIAYTLESYAVHLAYFRQPPMHPCTSTPHQTTGWCVRCTLWNEIPTTAYTAILYTHIHTFGSLQCFPAQIHLTR